MGAIAVITKRVNDKFEVVLRYQYPDILANETIDSANVTAENGLGQNGSPTISGNEVGQWISGGNNGTEYDLTFKATMSSGRILEDVVIVKVKN